MKALPVRLGVALSLAIFSIAAAPPALGLANRVFVSQRSGNNANSCDNILTPCQTFAGAVVQLNPGGEAIVLDSGGYGWVSITQSVTITAPPGVLAFIHPPSGNAVTVNAPGATVTVVLRGLTIDGAGATTGSGINVGAAAFLHVENCVITGFAGIIGADGNGIYVTSPGKLFVKDTVIRANGGVGIWVFPSTGVAEASVDHCRLEENGVGLLTGPNGMASIRDSVVSGNGNGLYVASNAEVNAEGCLVANNSIGLETLGLGSILRASNCTVTDNGEGVIAGSGSFLLSRLNNTVEGNGPNGAFTGPYSAK